MKIKKLILCILIPNIFGLIGYLLGGVNDFNNIIKPSFTPPGYIFPIVWSILFTLMGISLYLISENKVTKSSYLIFIVNLIVNSLWTMFFFNFKWYLFSFIWILFLIGIVIIMIINFYKYSKISAIIQIPYLIWLVFAGIITYNVYILNP